MNDRLQLLFEAQRALAMLRELHRPGPFLPPVPQPVLIPYAALRS